MQKSIRKAIEHANITFDENEVNEILKNMTEEQINDTGRLGIAHTSVMINLTKKKMHDELNLDPSTILNESFMWGPVSFTVINRFTVGGIFFYRFILTADKIYAYGYDHWFRCTEKHIKPLSQLDGISQSKTGAKGSTSRDGITLKFKDEIRIVFLGITSESRELLAKALEDIRALRPEIINTNIFSQNLQEII